ncbi:MAG: YlbF family regulator [Gemmatimonadota bacterium]
MSALLNMARDLGGALARTDEYQALRRAIRSADEDADLTRLRDEMDALEARVAEALRGGQEPESELAEAYNETFGRLQTNSSYQRLVAAQSNFDKVLMRVNETITQGLEEGGESRIILPS